MAVDWNLACIEGVPGLWGHIWYILEISRISFWKGDFSIKHSVDFWYWQISHKATNPGLIQ